jgi:hypothetical protein
MRPFEIMEANIMLPIGLSIKSGRIAPIARYLGSIIVLSRGIKNTSPKNMPNEMPRCPKRSIRCFNVSSLISIYLRIH